MKQNSKPLSFFKKWTASILDLFYSNCNEMATYGITFVVIRGIFFTVYNRKQAQLTASKFQGEMCVCVCVYTCAWMYMCVYSWICVCVMSAYEFMTEA